MNESHVSTLMLERYRLGEVTAEELKLVEAALALDEELRSRYESLGDSDRELRRLYPWEQSALRDMQTKDLPFGRQQVPASSQDITARKNRFPSRGRLIGLCAAALFICMLFPSVNYLRGQWPGRAVNGSHELGGAITGPDRLKGVETKTELSIYLKEKASAIPADEGLRLQDLTLLKEGSTVQLAYLTPPGNSYYGVIFSIDGRSALTMHYPYRKGQSPLLTAGRRTFLSEAYTLDDAPLFEIFFLVASREPLNTEDVLETARELAKEPETVLERSARAFEGLEVETITIRK